MTAEAFFVDCLRPFDERNANCWTAVAAATAEYPLCAAMAADWRKLDLQGLTEQQAAVIFYGLAQKHGLPFDERPGPAIGFAVYKKRPTIVWRSYVKWFARAHSGFLLIPDALVTISFGVGPRNDYPA